MKTVLLATAAALTISGPAGATVIFDHLTLTSDAFAAAGAVGANTSSYTVGIGHATQQAGALPSGPLTIDAYATATARTTTVTVVHHPDTYAPGDTHHLHPIHHPDTFVRNTATNATAYADEAVAVDFVDAGTGTFSFDGLTDANVLTPQAGALAYNVGQQINYAFSLVGNSQLDLYYDLTESYNLTGQHNFVSLIDLTASNTLFSGSLGNNVSGDMNINLLGGHNYRLRLTTTPRDDMAARLGVGDTFGNHNEFYSWAISAVPEPASWALMLGGFGLAGATLRRRRGALA